MLENTESTKIIGGWKINIFVQNFKVLGQPLLREKLNQPTNRQTNQPKTLANLLLGEK
jgi:hypothetical protein